MEAYFLAVKTKAKQFLTAYKIMCTVFLGRTGILLIEFLMRCEIVSANVYCETLKKLEINGFWG